jgi:uncharacterized membrane protein
MDKQQIIAFIENQIAQQKISREDLLTIAQSGGVGQVPMGAAATPEVIQAQTSKNVINTFYVIGAIIVLVGVIILIAQNWDEIGFIGRIGVTLGLGLITYITGFSYSRTVHNVLSQVMFTISAVLMPMGIFILYSEMDIRITLMTQVMISLALAVIYGVAFISCLYCQPQEYSCIDNYYIWYLGILCIFD